MAAPDPTIEVTLRCVDNQDDFPERKLVLGPATRIPVGRCSKSAHKQLFAAADNLYIDSPVISRDHAVLTANTSTGIPCVYIMDKGSMHGTTVNSVLLPSDREHKLNNGDTIQFGADVMRDTDSYFAKKYRFESRLLPIKAKTPFPSSFPTSFTVPETTSSDEEEDIDDIEDVEDEPKTMPSPPRPGYGSQTNPVNVDDYEDVPADFLDFDENEDDSEAEQELGEVTIQEVSEVVVEVSEDKARNEEEKELSPEVIPHDALRVDPAQEMKEPEPSSQQTSFEENASDEEDDLSARSIASSMAEEGSEDDSDDSEDEQMSQDESDRLSDDGSEQSVDSVKEDLDTIRRLKMEEMLNHAQENNGGRCSSTLRGSSSQGPSIMAYPPRRPSPPVVFGYRPLKSNDAEKSMFDIFQDNAPFPDNAIQAPPIPPRPSAPCGPSSMIWNAPPTPLPGPPSDFGSMHHPGPWFEDSPALHMHTYTLPNPPDSFHPFSRPDNFSSPNFFAHPRPFMPQMATPYSESRSQGLSKPDDVPMNQVQSPEALKKASLPTPPTNVQDEQTAPTRRTKVSIPEIVEDNSDEQQEHPPTPTSMKGQKRKAEALEELEAEDIAMIVGSGTSEAEAAVETPAAPIPVVAPEVASLVAERPKKKLKTALVNAGVLATGIAIGAVGVFAGLLVVPESFLQ